MKILLLGSSGLLGQELNKILKKKNKIINNGIKSRKHNLISKENLDAYIYGPLAFDNAVAKKAAKIKNIDNEVAGDADILIVSNLEMGNALSKIMVYFMNACAAGIVVGGKVPVVVPSRADDNISKLASIAAAIIAMQ